MASREHIEKVRQEIMRFRELLDIMRMRLEDGERRYERLLAGYPVENRETLKEKELQWKVAEQMVDDLKPLDVAVSQVRSDCYALTKELGELHDIILTVHKDEDD